MISRPLAARAAIPGLRCSVFLWPSKAFKVNEIATLCHGAAKNVSGKSESMSVVEAISLQPNHQMSENTGLISTQLTLYR